MTNVKQNGNQNPENRQVPKGRRCDSLQIQVRKGSYKRDTQRLVSVKHITPTQLFKEQLLSIGERQASVVLDNFISTEKMLKRSLQYVNIKKLSMLIKVTDSPHSIKYTYDKKDGQLVASKILLVK